MFPDTRLSYRGKIWKERDTLRYRDSVRDRSNLGNASGNTSNLANSLPYSLGDRTTFGSTFRDNSYLVTPKPSREAYSETAFDRFDKDMGAQKRGFPKTKRVHQFHQQQTSCNEFIDYSDSEQVSRTTEIDDGVDNFQISYRNNPSSYDLNFQTDTRRSEQASTSNIPGSTSRFSSMSKYLKQNVSPEIDSFLATSVTDMFRKGVEREQYHSMIQEKNHPTPPNCDGLKVIRVNDEVWNSLSAQAKSKDKKMQRIATAVVKAAVVLTNLANSTAKLQKDCPEVGQLVTQFSDSLAFLGHANFLLNKTRRDFLRPELGPQNAHLCRHSLPFTDFLFGDRVLFEPSTEIPEENTKINGNKMMRGRPELHGRGSVHSRSYQENDSYTYPYSKQPPRKFRRENSNDRTGKIITIN